ncbi:MAG: LuxR family transcriptional regulator [Bacillales bacterium]|jgi:hypothetical protein|nr:LuxR family transcriptional regulator [Bacillales bacterium]
MERPKWLDRNFKMDKMKKKELQEQFKLVKTYMGVYQIRNNINGKIFIDAFPNIKNKWITLKMQLDMKQHANSELQKDWISFGEAVFEYTVLEEKDTTDLYDVRWETKQLLKVWLDKLQPYGEKGYNKLKD